MKKKLSSKEYIYVASMLFGLFFGAGNLIFPVYMGQMAGRHIWQAAAGFLITGVGLPLMGVAALGISRSSGLYEMGLKVSRGFSLGFTCLLYLTIGPFFAVPRLRHNVVHRRAGAGLAAGQHEAVSSAVLTGVLRRRAVFRAEAGKDSRVGGQGAQPMLPAVSGGAHSLRHAASDRRRRGCCA